MVSETVDSCVAQAQGIRERSPEALAILIEGLILSGIGMLVVGNSRPASGAEHHLSHYWEMKAITENRPEHFHGKKVGVGTAVMAKFYEKFLARDPFAIDLDDIKRRKEAYADWESRMRRVFGPVADSLIELKKSAFQEWDAQLQTIQTIQDKWEQIKPLQALEPTYARVVEIQQTVGAAYLPEEVDVDLDYLRETLLNAKDVRTQYTVMTVADTLGWLEEIVEEIIQEYA
jgi:glycerol-1-phosphate dehydrogenase [NAD(P)+]